LGILKANGGATLQGNCCGAAFKMIQRMRFFFQRGVMADAGVSWVSFVLRFRRKIVQAQADCATGKKLTFKRRPCWRGSFFSLSKKKKRSMQSQADSREATMEICELSWLGIQTENLIRCRGGRTPFQAAFAEHPANNAF